LAGEFGELGNRHAVCSAERVRWELAEASELAAIFVASFKTAKSRR